MRHFNTYFISLYMYDEMPGSALNIRIKLIHNRKCSLTQAGTLPPSLPSNSYKADK